MRHNCLLCCLKLWDKILLCNFSLAKTNSLCGYQFLMMVWCLTSYLSSMVTFFSNFSCLFLIPIIFSNLNSNVCFKKTWTNYSSVSLLWFVQVFFETDVNCSSLWGIGNLQVKKPSVTKNCPFLINCSSDLKNFANSSPSASNFKSFSQSLEHFFLTVGQNNFVNKIPFLSRVQQAFFMKTLSSLN